MPHPTAVLDIVGLSSSLIGEATPNIRAFVERGRLQRLAPVLPAVTCSVQSSMLTGAPPREHGIVGNGWYDRELGEVQFWKQSGRLVRGETVWETARRRDPSVTCAKMFWWFNMYSSADWSVTPRPMYKADGRKIPDCYSEPPALRDHLQSELGTFPLFQFWGPGTSIRSTQWIADASRIVHERHDPTLTLVYLPHLDYGLQKFGPEHPVISKHLREIDTVVGDLIEYFRQHDVRVILLSEYGIEPVDDAVHLNRVLREAGAVRVREEESLELLDAGASEAFAVADHQIAHVYVRDATKIDHYRRMIEDVPGVERVLGPNQKYEIGLDHPRAGELIAIAEPRRWFSYYHWLDDDRAPDFARTVDIHRKPGYDPVELFVNPAMVMPQVRIAWKLLRKKLGFRMLMDVIPLDASLVRGSHGRIDQAPQYQPVLITARGHGDQSDALPCTAVRDVILDQLFAD